MLYFAVENSVLFQKRHTLPVRFFAAEAARTPRFRPSLRYPKHRAHQAAGRSQGFFCRYEYRLCRSEAEGNKAARTVPAFRFCAEAACRVIRLLCFRSRLLEPKTPASKMSWRRSSLSAAGIRSGFGRPGCPGPNTGCPDPAYSKSGRPGTVFPIQSKDYSSPDLPAASRQTSKYHIAGGFPPRR